MRKIAGKRILVFGIIIVAAFGLIVGSSFFYGKVSIPPFVQRFTSDVSAFFNRGTTIATSAIQRSTNSLGNLFETYRRNGNLLDKVDELAQQQIEIENLRKENKQLKENLELKGSLVDYSTVTAVIINRSPTTWNNQLTINKGLNAEIKKNSPVLSSKGLIGKVIQVSNTSAKIELISDVNGYSDRFPVSINLNQDDPNSDDSNSVNGIVSEYEQSSGLLTMDELTSDADVKVGMKVQTSGLGGILPKGLFVGTVTKVEKKATGIAKKIYIQPAANLNELSSVLVVTGKGNKNAE